MAGYPRDYYSESRRTRTSDQVLPPLREVVGDLHHIGRRPSHSDPYALDNVRYALPQDNRGPTLPPIHNNYGSHRESDYSRSHHEHYGSSGRAHPGSHSVIQSPYRSRTPAPAVPPAGPSRSSGGGGYAEAPIYDDEPIRRHKCEYCGKKFDRPSSLQVHVRTHTGDQPFACEWPGCARTFNVRSNMLRHFRSHERQENPGPPSDDDDTEEAPGSMPTYNTKYYRPHCTRS